VQGVGFRPFVYRLAVELDLVGFVLNDSRGVRIEVQGAEDHISSFARRLRAELPPLARITRSQRTPIAPVAGETAFVIRASEGGEIADVQVTVDTAVCEDCLREMNDRNDPRYRYPFINCTNCGPRYTIVRQIPYDRPNTTMTDFAMCPLCSGEYADLASRRFHAQPIACGRCGPNVWLVDTHGKQVVCDDSILAAAEMLKEGKIIAIKGLGGFHLACKADDDHVVRRLRQRKRRDEKPFALMVGSLAVAERLCDVNEAARKLLTGPLRPVVIMPRRIEAHIAASVAEGLGTLGIMLPYTPLQHLLFGYGLGPLVMTSGNYSEEPLVKDNDAAMAHLGGIADAVLLHNRRIERRVDDSVVQAGSSGHEVMLRRARGYAPSPILLPAGLEESPQVLAVGAELKNTICLLKSGRAALSEYIGDLKDGRTYRHFIDTINHLEALLDVEPEILAADMHPHYLSSQYAMRRHMGELGGRPALPMIRVQHHHAHIAACLAEHGRDEPAIGIACDGVGYGDDGAVWGGEIFRADLTGYERLGHLRYMPLVGGDAASVDTFRPAIAALHDTYGERAAEMADRIHLAAPGDKLRGALEILNIGVHCPLASSLGRWFDAVASLTNLTQVNGFEGQAPMLLEAAIQEDVENLYEFKIISAGPFVIDLRPTVRGIVADVAVGDDVGLIAAKFHNTVAAFLAASARRAREETHLNLVALSGGCFANRYLADRLLRLLAADGFEVLMHHLVPTNDGAVALGQAVVAAAQSRAKGLLARKQKAKGRR
jgi:hydrogenase maturation protein HypF